MLHFEHELAELKDMLLTMASYAENAVRRAVDALMTRDERLAQNVKLSDDVIDRYEVEVDETAIQLLAKAPLASNLRLIAVAMKISQNLERVGDEAAKIAKRVHDLIQEPPLKQVEAIPHLADLALELLKSGLDAFVSQDSVAARALIPRDKEIDALNRQIYRELANGMMTNRETITRALNLIVVSKSLERIADHAKNIAEEDVYLCEAKDMRHTGKNGAASTQAEPAQGG